MKVEISIGKENFEEALQTDDGLFFIYCKNLVFFSSSFNEAFKFLFIK